MTEQMAPEMREPLNRGEATAALDAYGLESILDDIVNGLNYLQIAAKINVSKASFVRWLALDADRSARARDALQLSAQTEDDKAEMTLLRTDLDPHTKRELAQHYRWRARVRNPRDYGDKLQVESNVNIVNLSEEEIARRRAAIQEKLNSEQSPPAIEAPRE